METTSFASISHEREIPEWLPGPLRALLLANRGSWNDAHELVQNDQSKEAAWVHAYLHRVEGDIENANYWYRRSGRPSESGSLEDEYLSIGEALFASIRKKD